MISAVAGLVDELRRAGIPVSVADQVDAVAALRFIDLSERAEVKAALGTALVKDAGHEPAYSTIFDLYFALRAAPQDEAQPAEESPEGQAGQDSPDSQAVLGGTGPGEGTGSGSGGGPGVLSRADDAGLREMILDGLRENQDKWLRQLAAEAVSRYAGLVPGRAVAGTYYLFRAMRGIGGDSLAAQLAAESPGQPDALGQTLMKEEYERRVAGFRQEIEAEIRRRMVADRGAADVARTLRVPLPEDAEFLTASAAQIGQLRGIVAPLARKLAAGLAARHRGRRQGPLDFRRTARESMSTGGVPMEPVFRPPRPSKPELVILADISGSVSTFAEFTLHLTFALRAEFTRVRSFVFVDVADEVTDILSGAPDITAATAEINARGCGVWLDGHSDYGNALRIFAERDAPSLRSRSTVLILGDARANYRASGAAALRAVARQAGHVFWLNPEPATAWNSGDSVMREYAPYCDSVVECRNVRQLRTFIERLP